MLYMLFVCQSCPSFSGHCSRYVYDV